MADRKNNLGLSVAIGAGVGAALGVALHHLPLWLSLGCVVGIVTGIILTRNDAILILSRYFGSLNKAHPTSARFPRRVCMNSHRLRAGASSNTRCGFLYA